jgi:hypothetical protein
MFPFAFDFYFLQGEWRFPLLEICIILLLTVLLTRLYRKVIYKLRKWIRFLYIYGAIYLNFSIIVIGYFVRASEGLGVPLDW